MKKTPLEMGSAGKRLLIANRGEIACRVLRSALDLGFEVGVLCPSDDADGVAAQTFGPGRCVPVSSYLSITDVAQAAQEWNADLVHPGYGFLSENADFVRALSAKGIEFVGPTAEQMHALGDKQRAKEIARTAGVPTLEAVTSAELQLTGKEGLSLDQLDTLLQERAVCAPWLVKASGGGGGRGMRIVQRLEDLPSAVRLASQEAEAGFGNPEVFIERYMTSVRHIEVQVFGDGKGGGVALGERECTLQRRHQKVVEEAPSVAVDARLRRELCQSALALVRHVSYRGAGTVEFLLTDDAEFFFLEMNTRLQVEHPVTEEVFRVDLVRAQLMLASGAWDPRLGDPDRGECLEPRGHAVEVRVLAEDPKRDFLPTPGNVVGLRLPDGLCRVESGVCCPGRVNPQYDSMIGKLIAVGDSREEALEKMRRGLADTRIFGFPSNVEFLRALLDHSDVRWGSVHTGWIAEHLPDVVGSLWSEALSEFLLAHRLIEQVRDLLICSSVAPESLPSSFRMGGSLQVTVRPQGLETSGSLTARVSVSGDAVREWAWERLFNSETLCRVAHELEAQRCLQTGQIDLDCLYAPRSGLLIGFAGAHLHFGPEKFAQLEGDPEGSVGGGEVLMPMPGRVLELRVSLGDAVKQGTVVAIVESMKMQLEVVADKTGIVKELNARSGQNFEAGALLALISEEKE